MKQKILISILGLTITIACTTIALPFHTLSTTRIAQAAKQETKPIYKSRDDIPPQYKWKLEDIYVNKEAWEADLKLVYDLANRFTRYQGKLSESASTLRQALDDFSTLMQKNDRVSVYALLAFDAQSSNPEVQELKDRSDKMSTLILEKVSWLNPEIATIPDDKIADFVKDPSLASYLYFISDSTRTKPNTLSKELEQLLAQSSPLAAIPQNTFDMLTKNIPFPAIQDANGKGVELTRTNFASYLESKNRNLRKQAFQTYYQTLTKYQDTFAQILNGEVQANNFYAKARKYPSALAASLTPNNIPVHVYNQLINAVNQNLPLLHRYMGLKKKMLGVDELHMYDIYAPIVETDDHSYIPYEEAKNRVLAGLNPLGDEYIKVLKDAFASNWIDVYSTSGKAGGGYQITVYDTHPYILLNYEGTQSDVSTIAHELGHAMQSYYTNKKQPYISSSYPIFTAEVASTMNENILWESAYKNAQTKQQKMFLLNQHLENFRNTLFRQTQFAEFEKLIHEKEQIGESLNAEALKKLYLDINKKYYGPNVISDDEIALEWARVPHFYYNFYVYQYATSFAASTALAKKIMEGGQPAFGRIRDNFLSAGNSRDPISVLKAAGVDMSSPKPIEETMQMFKETLDELEQLFDS